MNKRDFGGQYIMLTMMNYQKYLRRAIFIRDEKGE